MNALNPPISAWICGTLFFAMWGVGFWWAIFHTSKEEQAVLAWYDDYLAAIDSVIQAVDTCDDQKFVSSVHKMQELEGWRKPRK